MSYGDIFVGIICYVLLDEWAEKKQIGLKIRAFIRKIKARMK